MSETNAQENSHAETRTRPYGGGWPLWWRWVLATAVGFALPEVGTAAVGYIPALQMIVRVAGGPIVGITQWAVLRRYIKAAGWWILATAAPLALLDALSVPGGISPDATRMLQLLLFVGGAGLATILAIVEGAVLGFAQWLVLRRHFKNAAPWVLASAVAWLVGVVVRGFLVMPPLLPGVHGWVWWREVVRVVVLRGVVVGAITGIALVRLLQTPLPGSSEQSV